MTQYHFTSWPDHGVPKFATSLIAFIRRVQKGHNKDDGYPLLVHCSAGVGRTGTFILLDSMLERMKKEETVNVYEFLFNMRAKRTMMVQSQVSHMSIASIHYRDDDVCTIQAQYIFIHDALDELITCGETDISAAGLRVKVNRLRKTIPGKGNTGFAEQFQVDIKLYLGHTNKYYCFSGNRACQFPPARQFFNNGLARDSFFPPGMCIYLCKDFKNLFKLADAISSLEFHNS